MKKLGMLAAGLAALVFSSGCGDTASTSTPPPAQPPPKTDGGGAAPTPPTGGGDTAAKTPFPKDKATGSVMGMVTFEGEVPKRLAVQIQGDDFCTKAHPDDNKAYKEDVVIDPATKAFQYAFVYVKTGASQWSYEVPKEPVVIEQHGCVYSPHVVGVMAKQTIHVDSKDDTKHNVHFISPKGVNKEDNKEELKGQSLEFTPAHEEIMAGFKCDIHSWMLCQVGVVSNPFFAVSGADGKYEFAAKLPAGKYTVACWTEKFGEQTQDVTVEDGKPATLNFTVKAK